MFRFDQPNEASKIEYQMRLDEYKEAVAELNSQGYQSSLYETFRGIGVDYPTPAIITEPEAAIAIGSIFTILGIKHCIKYSVNERDVATDVLYDVGEFISIMPNRYVALGDKAIFYHEYDSMVDEI